MTEVLELFETLLESSWNSVNTDNEKPTVDQIFNAKRRDFTMQGSKSYVLLYEISNLPADNATGAKSRQDEIVIAADVRTMVSRTHAIKLRDEVNRICDNNQVLPFSSDTSYDILEVTDNQDLSDKSKSLWRFQIKIKINRLNRAV